MNKKEKLLEALREVEAMIDRIICDGGVVRADDPLNHKLVAIRRKIWKLDGTFAR